MPAPALGFVFPRTWPARSVVDVAQRLEAMGATRLWLVEDCFYTTATPLAAAALTATDRLGVGIGILPAVVRTAAVTAMELATLDALAPGRLVAGVGHGVQAWMAQMGVAPASPLTAIDEVLTAVRRLLAGEEVTVEGSHVHLDRVRLDAPPARPVPVLAGVRGAKSLAVAGRAADGVILAEPAGPHYVRWARQQAGDPPGFRWVTYAPLCLDDDGAAARRAMAPWLAEQLRDPTPGITTLPFADELRQRWADGGVQALADLPADRWTQIAPVGDLPSVLAHLDALAEAGVAEVGLAPSPDPAVGMAQLADLQTILTARS